MVQFLFELLLGSAMLCATILVIFGTVIFILKTCKDVTSEKEENYAD